MDEGLAKGYASDFVRQQADHSAIREWLASPRRAQAFKIFALSSQMEHEGRVLERMTPLVRPPFTHLFIPTPWSAMLKSVSAQLISAAPETEVFNATHSDDLDFNERSVFMNNLTYSATAKNVGSQLLTLTNISHHTITRLLQRNLADQRSLDYIVGLSLAIARDLAQIFIFTSPKKDETFDFIIPFMGGALVARTMKVSPGIERSYQGDQWVFSLRTFLEEGMLKSSDHERMAGMNIEEDGTMRLRWLGQTREMQRGVMRESDVNHIKGWLQANARPSRPRANAR